MNSQMDLFGNKITKIPKTQGIKYAGSKLKLLPYIISEIESLQGVRTVLDGFSGTTRVSQALSQLSYSVTSNDISIWSECFAKCYLLNGTTDQQYQQILDHLNNLEGYDGWFTENYGGETSDVKKPFQRKNTRKLDAIRDEIDRLNLNDIDKNVVLTSLILALDSVDSTLGHYVSYLNKWSTRSYNDLLLKLPLRKQSTSENRVLRGDIFSTIAEPNHYDLAYFDPPYGSNNEKMPPSRVRYASYYHIWKSVILNDKPQIFGKAMRREDSRDEVSGSVFEEFRKNESGRFIAMDALENLIKLTNANYILLSYSSGGRATKEELISVLQSNGRLISAKEIDYKRNVMSSMNWTGDWLNSDGAHCEYLFLIKK